MVAATKLKTGFCFTPIVIDKFIAQTLLLENRVLFFKAFERLEPCAGKLARTVLRGEECRNASLLPGRWLKGMINRNIFIKIGSVFFNADNLHGC